MTQGLKFSRRWQLGTALSMAMAIGAPAHADAPDLVQLWEADWRLADVVNYPSGPDLVGDARGDGSGNLNITASPPKGSLSGDMTLSFDPANGSLRSSSNVQATLQCCDVPTSYGYGDFNFASFNVMLMSDQLTVAHDGFGFMTISVRTTGSLAHTASIIAPPYGYSDISLSNSILARVSIAGGETAQYKKNLDSKMLGILDGTFTVNDNLSVSETLEVIVPWENNLPVTMSFAYQEYMGITVLGLDAQRVEITGNNSFGHTLQMFVNVYDNQGQLLQGVLQSSQSIGYQNLVAVPEPSSWLLMAAGLMGLVGWRRRAGR